MPGGDANRAASWASTMPSSTGGTYVLVLRLDEDATIGVGKLGEFVFSAGYYLYVGSARGSGGLSARIERHKRADKKVHWHIDHLLPPASIVEVWWIESPRRLECKVAEAIRAFPDVSVPAPGFGSSDCGCSAHLFYSSHVPDFQAVRS